MATFDFTFYADNPGSYGFPTGTGTFTYTGPSEKTGVGQITDNGSGQDGQTFTDNDGVTGTFSVNGNTSTNVSTEPDGGYVLRDTVTGEEFRVVGFDVAGGPAAGTYTISEQALVPGRSYQVLQYEDDPSAGGAGVRYAEVVCYASGTMIDTPDGERAVETLCPGDLVMTLDHGPQTIVWVRSDDQPLKNAEAEAKPVLIAAGALGPGRPAQDLIVSPQHRILVGAHHQLQGRFETEAFAPAKSLTSLRGIRYMKGKTKITWVHFACDRHEVVTANGCLSESLLLGPMVVNGLTATERQAARNLFAPAPTPDAALNGTPARECLTMGAVRLQLAKSSEVKENRVLAEIRQWDVDAASEQYETERLREEEPTSGRRGISDQSLRWIA